MLVDTPGAGLLLIHARESGRVTDSYYELIDADMLGEKFKATDMARGTWSAAIQHGGPVSALLVRALERCEQRDDTRLSRVVIDLLGGVPSEGDLWVSSQVQRGGKQIELVSAEMRAQGPDGQPRPVARASGWRLQRQNTEPVAHAAAALPRPVDLQARVAQAGMKPMDLGPRNYVHSLEWLWLTESADAGTRGIPGSTPTVDLVNGETMIARSGTTVRGGRLRQRHRQQAGHLQVGLSLNTDLAVHVFRVPEGKWIGIRAETSYGP